MSADTDTLTRPVGGTITGDDARTVPAEPGDHDRFAHYVKKAAIAQSMVEGTPAIALCGKVWVPNRSPESFPVCAECEKVWLSLNPGV